LAEAGACATEVLSSIGTQYQSFVHRENPFAIGHMAQLAGASGVGDVESLDSVAQQDLIHVLLQGEPRDNRHVLRADNRSEEQHAPDDTSNPLGKANHVQHVGFVGPANGSS
jgi:hypothetical protein